MNVTTVRRFWKKSAAVVLLGVMMTVSACANNEKTPASTSTSTEKEIKVTTTVGMITDIVENVGSTHVKVTGLMNAGVDPHLYKASQGDIKKLDDAQIIFYNGLHLEGKMVEILEKMGKQKPTVAVSDKIDRKALRSGAEMETEYDPHIWFNVKHWMKATEQVRDSLSELDPAHKEDYKNNAAAYLVKLQELDRYATEQIALIPEASRVLVTAHDAFGYFGDAYHIQVKGLQGISTASEYGSKDVSQLRDFLVEKKVKAVFVESSVPKKSIEAVIQGAKEKGHQIQIGGELFSDAMGKTGTPEGTYVGMVRHNVDTIVNALK
ncbi:manganese/zinc/iron transport system substrate-binding protein [Paenibacillus sp. V4I3]|uniref:metal ABC transporter solute-binding protein, Zn/Mn family n=1 Tax=unclassified Paenibacillus TaxID=185978 RepID=UPI002780EA45|nr:MULTISPECIES: zinc ABC transporter substrate-binding protein [unclassified Paenibacillus]MDQ0875511.1 manganese/zinc/iron transport system substrate-binding protein [Paenibacillus sp. V4I3]MDQ0888408.1 manganese/zinc/iron transport system substrate-binding protein [Paenibacillus sp. V4I9]